MLKIVLIFTIATAINVVLSTIRSLCTIKCGKWLSAIINAICYGFYCWVVVLTALGDLSLWTKIIVTALCNFIGVWVVKWGEEKAAKDRMWKFELAIPYGKAASAHDNLRDMNIPHNFVYVGSWCMFNCYCMTQSDSTKVVDLVKLLGGKYSAYESKVQSLLLVHTKKEKENII